MRRQRHLSYPQDTQMLHFFPLMHPSLQNKGDETFWLPAADTFTRGTTARAHLRDLGFLATFCLAKHALKDTAVGGFRHGQPSTALTT